MKKRKNMTVRFSICLVLVLAALSLVAACAEPSPAPSPTPTPEKPSPTPTPEKPTPTVAPIELKFAGFISPAAALSIETEKWGRKVEELSEGRVKITFYWGETLVKTAEMYRATQTGVADCCHQVIGIIPGLTPLNEFVTLPFIGWPSMQGGSDMYREMLDSIPELKEEFSELKIYRPRYMAPSHLHTVDKIVRVPADLKGMKVISQPKFFDTLEAEGAAPLQVHPADYYMSFERGLADAVTMHFPGLESVGCLELLPYHTILGEGGFNMSPDCILFNLDSWNHIPPDVQKIIEDIESEFIQDMINCESGEIQRAQDKAKELEHTFTSLTPDEIQLWMTACQPIHEKWIADQEAEGRTEARAIYNEAKRRINEYSK